MFIDACSTSSIFDSTVWPSSSAPAIALACRASIFWRTSSRVGTSWPTVSDSELIVLVICSCILAWSSWESSF